MSIPNAYKNYQRTTVETASPGKLIIMLYDGAIKFLEQARRELNEKRPKEAHYAIVRAEDILSELMSALNMDRGGEIAQNLLALYEFMFMRLVDANMRKDPSPIDEVLEFMRSLRESWNEAVAQQAADDHQDDNPQLAIETKVEKRVPSLFGSRPKANGNGGGGAQAPSPEETAPPSNGDGKPPGPAPGPTIRPTAPKIPFQQLKQFQIQSQNGNGNGNGNGEGASDPKPKPDDETPPVPPRGGLDFVS